MSPGLTLTFVPLWCPCWQLLRNHPWKGPQHLASVLPLHLPRADADPCPMNLDNAVTFLNR